MHWYRAVRVTLAWAGFSRYITDALNAMVSQYWSIRDVNSDWQKKTLRTDWYLILVTSQTSKFTHVHTHSKHSLKCITNCRLRLNLLCLRILATRFMDISFCHLDGSPPLQAVDNSPPWLIIIWRVRPLNSAKFGSVFPAESGVIF